VANEDNAEYEEWLDSVTGRVRMNAPEGDGEGDSPLTERESEEKDENHWWLRSSGSPSQLRPAFLGVGGLDQPGNSKKKRM
jgi:hypothetical protein